MIFNEGTRTNQQHEQLLSFCVFVLDGRPRDIFDLRHICAAAATGKFSQLQTWKRQTLDSSNIWAASTEAEAESCLNSLMKMYCRRKFYIISQWETLEYSRLCELALKSMLECPFHPYGLLNDYYDNYFTFMFYIPHNSTIKTWRDSQKAKFFRFSLVSKGINTKSCHKISRRLKIIFMFMTYEMCCIQSTLLFHNHYKWGPSWFNVR